MLLENKACAYQNQTINQYQQFRKKLTPQSFDLNKITRQTLEKHNIQLTSKINFNILKQQDRPHSTDCLFSIVKTQNFGLQYTYDVLFGPFKLKILILNLTRNSDDGDDQIDQKQLGSGGFGSVRFVKINDQQFAVKRIPFLYRSQPEQGYDFETQKEQQMHLKRCIRQFCLYKICSLIGVGPKIVKSHYDLICFNNCIQFQMQLCESINQISWKQNEILFEKIQYDLQKRLQILHSLGIVHRDIKPQNILYSCAHQHYVFGDFGMSLLMKQNYQQKTLTKFAGTPNFCGDEMKKLIDGGAGYVNLFINDFQSLKITLKYFQQNIIKEHSRISRNSMSYNDYQSFEEANSSSFQKQLFSKDNSSLSLPHQTDSSFIPTPTNRSLLTLTSIKAEAPRKFATAINYYESNIIYHLCRKLQQREDITVNSIEKLIDQNCPNKQNQQILINLMNQILVIFLTHKSNQILNTIKEWKNSSRHYGPTAEIPMQLLDRIIEKAEGQEIAELKKIKKQINSRSFCGNDFQTQFLLIKKLRYAGNFCLAFISFLKNEISKQQVYKICDKSFLIARQYIYCMKNLQTSFKQSQTLTSLILTYFKTEHSLLFASPLNFSNMIDSVNFCYFYLNSHNKSTTIDLFMFIRFHLNSLNYEFSKIMTIDQIKTLLHSSNLLLSQTSTFEIKWHLTSLYLKILSTNPSIKFQTQTILDQLLEMSSDKDTYTKMLVYDHLTHFHLYTQQFQKAQSYATKNQQLLKKIDTNLDYRKTITVRILRVQGEINTHLMNFPLAVDYYKSCIYCLQAEYDHKQIIEQLIDIKINISFIYTQTKQYQLACNYLLECLEILDQTDSTKMFVKQLTILQNYIYTLLKKGINDIDVELLKWLLKRLVNILKKHVNVQTIMLYKQIIALDHNFVKTSDRILVYKELLRLIEPADCQIYFVVQFQSINFTLSKYYLKELGHLQVGLKYLWKFINSRMTRSKIGEQDFQIMNMFAEYLMKANSFRRAIIFIKKYMFHIPTLYASTRNKTFYLMYRAQVQLEQKMSKIFHQITKNDCHSLVMRDYSNLMAKEGKNKFIKKILQKFILKL